MLTLRQKGVSLIEVIIGIAIMGVLMGLGVPEYSKYLANARLKATADTLVSGLSRARVEAVTRNSLVELVLTNEDPIAGLANSLPPDVNGINWMVRAGKPTSGYTFIEGKFGAEGSGKEGTTSVRVTASSAIAIFNGYGALTTGGLTITIDNPGAGTCVAAGGPMRCLTINVSSGGQIRTCDPAVNAITNPTDTRAC